MSPQAIPVAPVPKSLASMARLLDSDGNAHLEPSEFASRAAFDAFADKVERVRSASETPATLAVSAYAGRAVSIDPALNDAAYLTPWIAELAGPVTSRERVLVVSPGSDFHLQALELMAAGEPLRVVTADQVSQAVIAKRNAAGALGPYGVRMRAPLQQTPNMESFLTTPDGAPTRSLDGKVALHVCWYVAGFGHIWLEADNGGAYFDAASLPRVQLNYELARSRVRRNDDVMKRYTKAGLAIPADIRQQQAAARSALSASSKAGTPDDKAALADKALAAAVSAGEATELAWSAFAQRQKSFVRPAFGADSRHYWLGRSEAIDALMPKLLDVATITHYVSDSWAPHFEPREGVYNWGIRDEQLAWLERHGITAEARPILWPHEAVTPEFLASKSFDELKTYIVNHATKMVEHWGERITRWEIANEMHDWANVHELTPSQITEIIGLIAKTVRKLQPHAKLLVNCTNAFGECAGLGQTAQGPGENLRTPFMFVRDLIAAGVDFDIIGLQFYRPQRDLSDTVRLIEKFETLGKKIRISEAEAPSTDDGSTFRDKPFDEKQQADWAESLFRVVGTRPSCEALFWYDISDVRAFMTSGGLLASDGTPKQSYERLLTLRSEWTRQEWSNRQQGD